MDTLVNLILHQLKSGEITRDVAHALLQEIKHQRATGAHTPAKAAPQPTGNEIAVIGMHCRFPDADTVEDFWQNLTQGRDSITEFPQKRCPHAEFYSSDLGQPNKSYTKYGGFVEGIDQFATTFFKMSPQEAALIDPQQRLFIETALHTFQSAGYGSKRLWGSKTAVFVGARMSTYESRAALPGENFRFSLTGNLTNFIAARVSDFFNLNGPALTVDTACSSALVAIHYACQSLANGECTMALVGGVNLHITPYSFVNLSNAKALSFSGKSFVFDKRADGFIPGEGVGAVLLKSLGAAIRDGDTVYAVIKGSSAVNDGHTMGITTPNHEGQKETLRLAYQAAKVNPATVSYIEAHGTGTTIGDPIEIKALTEVFRECTDRMAYCAIGSVKTNIGHLDVAAGIAGFIKVVLCLHHKTIPPSLNCQVPNPRLNFVSSPFYPNVTLGAWEPLDGVRRAGVSSFGFGGTNCHVVVEEAPPIQEPYPQSSRDYHLLTLSAHSQKSLHQQVDLYLNYLKRYPEVSIQDFCRAANAGRDMLPVRLGIVAQESTELVEKLGRIGQTAEAALGQVREHQIFFGTKANKNPKLVFMFPGQGAQYPMIARELFGTDASFSRALLECDEIVSSCAQFSLVQALYSQDSKSAESLKQTEVTQPVMFAIGYALAQFWRSRGLHPSALMGHSLGEYVAACLAGIFTLKDALRLVVCRSRLMQQLPKHGAMAALFADKRTVEMLIAEVLEEKQAILSMAAVNGPANVVVSGLQTSVEKVCRLAKDQGIQFTNLVVSHAFHSPLMEPMIADFAAELDKISFKPVKIPLACNRTGKILRKGTLSKAYWLEHILMPVLFEDSANALLAAQHDVFLEVGSGTTLSSMVKKMLCPSYEPSLIATLQRGENTWKIIQQAMAQLFTSGCDLDFFEHDKPFSRKSIPLPLFPLERERCWVDQSEQNEPRENEAFYQTFSLEKDEFLSHHTILDRYVLPGVCYWELALQAGSARRGQSVHRLKEISHQAPLILSPQSPTQVRTTFEGAGSESFRIESRTGTAQGAWTTHAQGKIDLGDLPAPPPLDVESIKRAARSYQDAPEQIYRRFLDKGVRYGSFFQSSRRLWSGENFVLAELALGATEWANDGRFLYQPGLLDGALQSIIGLGGLGFQTEQHTYVPFFVQELLFYQPLPQSVYSLFQLTQSDPHQELITSDITVTDRAGKVKVQIKGLSFKRVPTTSAVFSAASRKSTKWFYTPIWVEKPRASYRTQAGNVLLFCHQGDRYDRLRARLEKHSQKMITVFPGSLRQRINDTQFEIRPENRQDYDWLCAELGKEQIVPEKIIHLWTWTEKSPQGASVAFIERAQEMGALSLLRIVQRFGAAKQPRLEVLTVSSYAVSGLESGGDLALEKSPLLGLSKVLPMEYEHVRSALIDIQADASDETIAALLDQLFSNASDSVVALRGERRFVPSIKPVDEHDSVGPERVIKRGGTYLITGGLGGIGFALARFLAENFQARLVLVSRSGFPPREQWEALLHSGQAEEAIRSKISHLRDMVARGAEVLLCRADVADRDQMAAVSRQVGAKNWKLDGIFHAAGVIRDRLLAAKKEEDFLAVLRPKVQGTWVLYELFGQDLDFLVLFSSVVSVFGNRGQCDYVAANNFMDAFAQWYAPAIALNWTLWAEAGMGERTGLVPGSAGRGIKPLTTQEGLDALFVAMKLGHPQVIIMNNDIKELLAAHKPSEEQPASESDQLGHNEHFFSKDGVVGQHEQEADEPDLEVLIEELLAKSIAQLIDVELQDVQVDENFLELGLDSVKLVEMTGWLGEQLGTTLYPTLLFEHPTVSALARHLSLEFAPQFTDYFKDTHWVESDEGVKKEEARSRAAPLHEHSVSAAQTQPAAPFELPLPLKVEQAPPSKQAKPLSAPALGLGSSKGQDIAIISMAGRFPQAPDLPQYWENLLHGVDAIDHFPLERLGADAWTAKDNAQAIPGGFLADIDQFDPLFFKVAPKEAAYIDPQQRLFLEVVWELLERAGYDQRKLQSIKTGVFVGASQVEYRSIWKDAANLSPYMGLGNSLCVIANRVSYLFNLQGPSLAVDTACSSSLVSVHMACQSLTREESDLAIAGGVQIYFSPGTFEIFALAGMLAQDGRCKTFDRWADGYVRGEGAGAVLLKPLSRAKEEGDYVYAVIKGSAVNHDGSNKVGISAPNPRAQKEVIAEALRQAELSPESIGYIEAHGTGTQLGDPVEIQALTEVFREHTAKRSFCAIGSAKSCIGHLEAAAGIAGLIKVVLALKNAKIPPTINFRQPNPHIPFQDSPFYINDKVREWDSSGGLNRAGISSFGFGGTNCHIILEEFKRDKPNHIPETRREELLTLSAKTPNALSQVIDNLISFVDANPQHSLHDICFSANTGRECFDYRVALTADTLEQLRDRLEILRLKGAEKAAHPYGVFYGDQPPQSKRVAFVLNGASGLQPTALQILAQQDVFPGFQTCCEILRSVSGEDFSQRGENELLSSGSVWHDLFLFSFTYAVAQKWLSLTLTPVLCIADGLGKQVAQVLAGAEELQDAISSLLGEAAAMAGPARQNIKIVDSNPVASLERVMRENKIGLCVEINGASPPPSNLTAHDFIFVPTLAQGRDLWAALVRETGMLYARGVTLSLESLYQGFENRRLVLPTYPFQRKRYWAVHTENDPQSETAKGAPHHSTPARAAQKPAEPSRQAEFQQRKTSSSHFPQVLRCLFAQTLAMDVEEINDRVHIADYGIDSLMIQNVIVKLEDIVGAFLEPSIFFEYPTIQSLAAFLEARYPETSKPQGSDSMPAPADEPESHQPGAPSDGRQKASLYTPPPKLEQLRQERLTILQDVAAGRLSGTDGFQKLKELEALHGSA